MFATLIKYMSKFLYVCVHQLQPSLIQGDNLSAKFYIKKRTLFRNAKENKEF